MRAATSPKPAIIGRKPSCMSITASAARLRSSKAGCLIIIPGMILPFVFFCRAPDSVHQRQTETGFRDRLTVDQSNPGGVTLTEEQEERTGIILNAVASPVPTERGGLRVRSDSNVSGIRCRRCFVRLCNYNDSGLRRVMTILQPRAFG